MSGWNTQRRFWTEVTVVPEGEGFGIRLDAREIRTPAKAALVVPTRAFAEAIAEEWRAITEKIEPDRLPLTKAANTAIDRVSRHREAVIDAIAAYGDTDLLCYRADEPEGLRARQDAVWQPWLDWAEKTFGAALWPIEGVMHHAQDPSSLAALRHEVTRHDALGLTALYDLVTLSGSLVLGLAVARGALPAADAWTISRLDEIWQSEQWGVDHEAERSAAVRGAAFLNAETVLGLLGTGPARSTSN